MLEIFEILVLGGFVGFVSAFLGLGGGILIVPLLPDIMNLSSHEAVATSLITIFLVVANNSRSFHRKNQIAWSVALIIGPLTALGAYASGTYAQHLPEVALRMILAAVVFVVFLRAGLRLSKRDVVDQAPEKASLGHLPWSKRVLLVGVGGFAGLLSGVSGIGAGLVISPLLIQLHLVRNERVSPTSNAVMLFTTFFGALAFAEWSPPTGWQWGYIHLDVALMLAGAAFITSYFARRLQGRLPIAWRLGLLTLLLAGLFLKMVFEVTARFL